MRTRVIPVRRGCLAGTYNVVRKNVPGTKTRNVYLWFGSVSLRVRFSRTRFFTLNKKSCESPPSLHKIHTSCRGTHMMSYRHLRSRLQMMFSVQNQRERKKDFATSQLPHQHRQLIVLIKRRANRRRASIRYIRVVVERIFSVQSSRYENEKCILIYLEACP